MRLVSKASVLGIVTEVPGIAALVYAEMHGEPVPVVWHLLHLPGLQIGLWLGISPAGHAWWLIAVAEMIAIIQWVILWAAIIAVGRQLWKQRERRRTRQMQAMANSHA
jgi:hypothetical protein